MSRTFTQRTELRFLYLALAFVLALAALVALPASEASADAGDTTTVVSGPSASPLALPNCTAPDSANKWSLASFVFQYDNGDYYQVCGFSEGSGWQNWDYDPGWEGVDPVRIHISCSDTFEGGYGTTNGPLPADGFQVISYHIEKAQGADCGDDIEAPASLTLVKVVVNDDGGSAVVGDFGITTTAGSLSWGSGTVEGSTTTYVSNTIGNLSAGTFAFSENDVAGYTEGTWSCTIFRLDQEPTIGGDFDEGSLVIAAGENWNCSITNNDVAPSAASLTLVKVVVNDDGGTAVVGNFGIVTSAGPLSWGSGTANGSTTTYVSNTIGNLSAGSFTFSENDVAGYSEGTWSCTMGEEVPTAGGAFGQGSLTIAAGEDWTCSITNNDVAQTVVTADVLNLSIVKTDNIPSDTIVLDDDNPTRQFTYSLLVTNENTSNITATDVLVSDQLPSRLTPVSATSTAGNCALSGQTVVCELGDMIVGQQETISITVSISRLPQGTASDAVITNIASVIADESETTYVDNTDDERLFITEVFGLVIEETTLPKTGVDTDAVAMVAGLMLLLGGALVAGSHYRRGESFTVDRLN